MNVTVKNYEEILAFINTYLTDGNKSRAVIKPAFHERAMVNAQPAQALFAAVDEGGETNAVVRVDIPYVPGDVACVRVVMKGRHGKNYADFRRLMKTGAGRKIVSKIFTEI